MLFRWLFVFVSLSFSLFSGELADIDSELTDADTETQWSVCEEIPSSDLRKEYLLANSQWDIDLVNETFQGSLYLFGKELLLSGKVDEDYCMIDLPSFLSNDVFDGVFDELDCKGHEFLQDVEVFPNFFPAGTSFPMRFTFHLSATETIDLYQTTTVVYVDASTAFLEREFFLDIPEEPDSYQASVWKNLCRGGKKLWRKIKKVGSNIMKAADRFFDLYGEDLANRFCRALLEEILQDCIDGNTAEPYEILCNTLSKVEREFIEDVLRGHNIPVNQNNGNQKEDNKHKEKKKDKKKHKDKHKDKDKDKHKDKDKKKKKKK